MKANPQKDTSANIRVNSTIATTAVTPALEKISKHATFRYPQPSCIFLYSRV